MNDSEKKIIILQEVDSTNNYANELIQSKRVKEGTAVLAYYQKKGRGQTGNNWISERGKNLLMSFILFPKFLTASQQFYISKITSISILHLLNKIVSSVSIKWPNDIYVNNKKIAGILIENTVTGNFLDSSVLGVGINVNQLNFASDIPNPVSLIQITGGQYDIINLAESLMSYIEYWYAKLKKHYLDEIDDFYINNLYKKDDWLLFKNNDKIFEARISDIDKYGQLILEDKNGIKQKFMFKEVEYIL